MDRVNLGETARDTDDETGTGAGTRRVGRGRVAYFTDAFLQKLKRTPGPFDYSETSATRGEGRLIALKASAHAPVELYFRQRSPEDKIIKLGNYDQQGDLAAARKKLRHLRSLQIDTGDAKGHLRAEQRRKETERRRGSTEQLLNSYVATLRKAGKPSAREAENIFKRHVLRPFPMLAATKAKDIGPDDAKAILARMVKKGIGRQVNICRAYCHAAWRWGAKADNDPRTGAEDGVLFGLTSNPWSLIPVIREFERARDRNLSEEELREFWRALDTLPTPQAATLRLNLALAGQRLTPLLRADWACFDFEQNALMLKDAKGRGGVRDHLVPLTDFALEQLEPLRALNSAPNENGKPPSPFSSNGKEPMVLETLSKAVTQVSLMITKEKGFPPFQMRDLRRTCETMLAAMGIPREIRAHVLSHGRDSGVQARHYDRYSYLMEKRAALERWADRLQQIIDPSRKAKVVPIRATA